MQGCVITNSEELKANFVVTLVTDFILLVTMFAGLFRLLTYGSYAFGVRRLLLKQVWPGCSPFAVLPNH